MRFFQSFISYLFFPLALLSSLAAFSWAYATGASLELAVVAPGAVTLVLAILFERFMPLRPSWNRPRGDTATDWFSMAALFAVADPLLKWGGPVLLATLYQQFALEPSLFPSGLPFALQVALATLVAEFGYYWAHRLHHRLPALWCLHALHHNSERLYSVNNFRLHPLNHLGNYALGMLPLLAIGTPADVLYGYLALSYPVLMLQHANLPLRSGWLNFVFSTNELHRWHHSAAALEGDSNFGRTLVVWDLAFGTFRYQARGDNLPRSIGLYAGATHRVRGSYRRQVFSMCVPGCCKAAV